jgi:hypothetical protein
MYVKLFDDLLDSTIWMEKDHIVRVWLTLLLLSNSEGFVEMPIPAIASRARVGLDECAEAIARLEAPDPYSRTGLEEGRRILRVTEEKTLWKIVNFEYYRALRSADQKREYQKRYMREYRARKKKTSQSEDSAGKFSQSETKSHGLAQAEAEAEAEAEETQGGEKVDTSLAEGLRSWNCTAEATGLPKAPNKTKRREAVHRSRLKGYGFSAILQVLDAPRYSAFLRGEKGRETWRGATYDWLMKLENFVKVLEGNYYDKGAAPNYDEPEEKWIVDTYRESCLHEHGNHSRWEEYTNFAAGLEPRSAKPFREWLEEQGGDV